MRHLQQTSMDRTLCKKYALIIVMDDDEKTILKSFDDTLIVSDDCIAPFQIVFCHTEFPNMPKTNYQ